MKFAIWINRQKATLCGFLSIEEEAQTTPWQSQARKFDTLAAANAEIERLGLKNSTGIPAPGESATAYACKVFS